MYFLECETVSIFSFVWMKFAHFLYLFRCTYFWFSSLSDCNWNPSFKFTKDVYQQQVALWFCLFQPGDKVMVIPSLSDADAAALFPNGVTTKPLPSGKAYLRYTQPWITPKATCWQIKHLNSTHTEHIEVTDHLGFGSFFFCSGITFHSGRIIIQSLVFLLLINTHACIWPRLFFRENILVIAPFAGPVVWSPVNLN